MKNSIPYRCEATTASNEDKLVLYLYGPVGGYWDGINSKDIRTALAGFSGSEIEVHLNSYGGDMFEGIAIKNYLSQRPETITVIIDGLAASAASIIAMAGDKILMPSDTQLMIHNPWTFTYGNAKELRKVADDLDKSEVSIQETYLKRFTGSREELVALLEAETFLTADEAVTLGLADAIYGDATDDVEVVDAESSIVDCLMAKYGDEKVNASRQAIERFAFLFAPKNKGE